MVPHSGAPWNFLVNEVPKAAINFMVEHEGPAKWYLQSREAATGEMVEIDLTDGHVYNSGWRQSRDRIPGNVKELTAASRYYEELKGVKGLLPARFRYADLEIDGPSLLMDDVANKKMGKWLVTMIQDMAATKMREDNRVFWGDGSGRRAEVQATAAIGAVTMNLKRPAFATNLYAHSRGAELMPENLSFVGYTGSTATRIEAATAHVVTGVSAEPAAGFDTISFMPALTVAFQPRDTLVEGDYDSTALNKEPMGLGYWLDDGRVSATHAGIPLVDFPKAGMLPNLVLSTAAAEGAAGHFQTMMHGNLHRALSMFKKVTGRSDVVIHASPEVLQELVYKDEIRQAAAGTESPSPLMQQPNQGGARGPGKFQGGYSDFVFYHPGFGQITLVADSDVPQNKMVFFRPDNIKVKEWEKWGAIPGANGKLPNGFLPAPTQDVYRQRYRESWNMYYKQPYESATIERITAQIDAVPIF